MSNEGSTASIPLWLYWLKIAEENAVAAEIARPSDYLIDSMADRLNGIETEIPDEPGRQGFAEMKAAMVAVAAAAHAIDALYGSVKQLVSPPNSRARRDRKIIETLKLGFDVGHLWQSWSADLEWVFGVRDGIVRHAEDHRPLVVGRYTARTVVISAPEAYKLSAETARRAASIARSILTVCLIRPKEATRDWAQARSHYVTGAEYELTAHDGRTNETCRRE